MQLAVNYSAALARLVADGSVDVDLFKTPAWPDLVAQAAALRPVYVHFPLSIGHGHGRPLDTERRMPIDWARVDGLLERTATQYVNVHFSPYARDGEDGAAVVERAAADLAPVVARYGAERVVVENEPGGGQEAEAPGIAPALIRRLVEEAGCGLLLDISHARLAAERLGWDARAYLLDLPLARVRELHVTGIQLFDAPMQQAALAAGIDPAFVARVAGRRIDHLAFTAADWAFLSWALPLMGRGEWGTPWVVAYEYGGVGLPWEAIGQSAVLQAQVPRLAALLNRARYAPQVS
jgi:uncharacterized protein (UPF0276 family)